MSTTRTAVWNQTLVGAQSGEAYPSLIAGEAWVAGTPLRLSRESMGAARRIKRSTVVSLSVGSMALVCAVAVGALVGGSSFSAQDRAMDQMLRAQSGEIALTPAMTQTQSAGIMGLSQKELLRRFVAFDRAY